MCSFQYKVLSTDAPNFLVKAFVSANSTTYNLITVYVNNTATGITKQNNLVSYTLFPNPANNVFAISGLKTANISVYNQLGSIVKQQAFENENISLSVVDLPQGVYMVVVWANGKKSVSKLVKE